MAWAWALIVTEQKVQNWVRVVKGLVCLRDGPGQGQDSVAVSTKAYSKTTLTLQDTTVVSTLAPGLCNTLF